MFFKKNIQQPQTLNNIIRRKKRRQYLRETNNKLRKKIVIIILIILIITGVVLGIYFSIYPPHKNNDKEIHKINNKIANDSKSDDSGRDDSGNDNKNTNNKSLYNRLLNKVFGEDNKDYDKDDDKDMNNVNYLYDTNNAILDHQLDNVNDDDDDNNNNKVDSNDIPEKEVYSVHTNQWEYDDAEAVCKLEDPEAELATYEQLVKSAENGAHWCNIGWIKSDKTTNEDDERRRAMYPIQKDLFDKNKDKCGIKWNNSNSMEFADTDYALQGGLYKKNNKFGVNCYGVKREMTDDEKWLLKQKLKSSNPELDAAIERVRAKKGDKPLLLHPYQQQQWSKYD